MTKADIKAAHGRGTSRAFRAWQNGATLVAVISGPLTMWMLPGAAVLAPTIRPDAPERIRDWVERRALANLTGLCPTCGAAAGVNRPTRIGMTHEPDCDVQEEPRDLPRWIVADHQEENR